MNKIKRSQIEEWDINRLSPYENNAKLHPDSHVEQIANSIEEFTFLDPVAVDEKGELLEGHGRLLAAKKRGDKTIPVIQVTGLTDAQKVAYRLTHNKLTMNTGFDPEMLKIDFEFLQDGDFELNLTGFDDLELSFLDDVMEDNNDDDSGSGEDDYEQPEEIISRVKLGDIWQLGRHKICCGDSTIESNVKALFGDRFGDVGMVWADPPFNTNQQQGRTNSEWGIIENDNLSDLDFKKFIEKFADIVLKLKPKSIYVCCSWRSYPSMFPLFPGINNLIVWVKNNFGLGSGYRPQYELIIFQGKIESNSESNVWNIRKDAGSAYKHPMQKPVELIEKALLHSSNSDDLIFDPFLGSAPSIIAAQKMEGSRTVYGFELSPDYCEVIIQRFEKFTGIEAKLIGTLSTKLKDDTQSEEYLNSLGF